MGISRSELQDSSGGRPWTRLEEAEVTSEKPQQDDGSTEERRPSPRIVFTSWMIPLVIMAVFFTLFWLNRGPTRTEISFDFLMQQIRDGNVEEIKVGKEEAKGKF